MTIILKTLGNEYNITNLVDLVDIPQTKTLDGTLNMSNIIIPFVRKEALEGVDLSKKIPLMSVVEITDLEETNQYYVSQSDVVKKNNEEYEHKLQLVELKYILDLRPIPDYSITQPIGDKTVYISETSAIISKKYNVYRNQLTVRDMDLYTNFISNDTSVVQDRVLKRTGIYSISTVIDIGELITAADRMMATGRVRIKVGDDIVVERTFIAMSGLTGGNEVGTIRLEGNYNNLVANQEVALELELYGTGSIGAFGTLVIKSGNLTIDYALEKGANYRYLDTEVEKLLSLVNVSDGAEFILDPSSKVRLSKILAFDDMATEQTLRTALEKIAKYVKARLSVSLVDNIKYVKFEFYDDLSKVEYVEPKTPQVNQSTQISEYTSGLALKNGNVIKENYIEEVVSLRSVSDTNDRLTTDNIAVKTKFDIDKIKSIEIKGKEIKYTDNTIALSANEWLDITDLVLEKPHYDTLDNRATYDDRFINNKNNHLYYNRGNNVIGGMSFIGTQFESWSATKTNRALYEVLATKLQRQSELQVEKFIDNGMVDDNNIIVRIKYYPLSETNAIVLKDDQTGFQEKMIRRFNVNDRVNNSSFLGDFTRTKVNSIGGTQKAVSGYATRADEITKLGTVDNDNHRVITITKYSNVGEIFYVITKVKDYVFESEYIGIDSDRRLYNIPKDEYVKRVDRAINAIYFDLEYNAGNNTNIEIKPFLKHLTNEYEETAPKVALINYDETKITTFVDVNAIGNTVEWYIQMKDNFSAGVAKKKITIDNNDIYYQQDIAYGDLFGNINYADIKYYQDYIIDLETLNNIPEGHIETINELGNIRYFVNKDAREQLALSTQVAMLSNHPNIYVYNGIGKYNRMVNFEEHEIGLAILHYTPNMDDTIIDLGRITPQVNNTILENDYIEVDLISSGEGFAFYHNETKELILAVVKRVNAGKHKIYYKGEIYSFNRLSKNNKAIFVSTYTDMYGSSVGNVGIIGEYNGNLDSIVAFSKEINDFFYIDVQLTHNNYGIIDMKEGVIDNTLSNLGSRTSLSGVITDDLYVNTLVHNNIYGVIEGNYSDGNSYNVGINQSVNITHLIHLFVEEDINVDNNVYVDLNANYGVFGGTTSSVDTMLSLEHKKVEPTETPTIEFQTTTSPNGMEYLEYRFRNNDRQQVVVYYTFDMDDIEVEEPMGSVIINGYNASRWYGLGCTVGNCNVFIAAYAKAVNKDKSDITNDWRS